MGSNRGGLPSPSSLPPPLDPASEPRLLSDASAGATLPCSDTATLLRTSRKTVYETIADAAPRLGLTPLALRARCRRGAVREGRDVRCYLGDGIVATKFGRTWRVRFPPV
jgi:hypothetical protein